MMMFWILCGAGVDHDHLVQLASKHFGGMSAGYEGEIPMLPPCRFTGSEVGSVLHCLLKSVNVVQLGGEWICIDSSDIVILITRHCIINIVSAVLIVT